MIKKKFWLFLVLIPLLMSTFTQSVYGQGGGGGSGGFGGTTTSSQFDLPGFLEKNINYQIETNLEESVQTREMNVQTWFVGNKNRTGDGIVGVGDTITFYFLSALGGTHFFTQSDEPSGGVYLPGGAIGDATNILTIGLARPPISSVEYLADLKSSFGFSEPILAQQKGLGFESLELTVLPLWKAMRNVAYLFFALIFVVIGLGIMFRVKINPQTAISIQSAIPQIIISLLLVTFSYAIAGFMFDLMYVSVGLIISIFVAPLIEVSTDYNPTAGMGILDTPGMIFYALGTIGAGALGKLVILGVIFSNPLFGIILLIMILYTLIKLLIMLLTTYAKIIIGVVFAPLQIMIGAIPGQPGFGKWFRNLLSNLAVLPTVITMILLAGLFIGYLPADAEQTLLERLTKIVEVLKVVTSMSDISGAIEAYWTVFAFALEPLIGLGIFFLIPKTAEMVRDALQVKPFPYGTGFGEALGPISKPAGYVGSLGLKAGSEGVAAGLKQRAAAMFGADTGGTRIGAGTAKGNPPPTI